MGKAEKHSHALICWKGGSKRAMMTFEAVRRFNESPIRQLTNENIATMIDDAIETNVM